MNHKIAQKLLNNLISRAQNVTGDNRLLEMWSNPQKYHDHVRRRLKAGHITSEIDYAKKTFLTLANAEKLVIAIPKQGDMISGKMELIAKNWIVLLGTSGEIVTSYPLNPLKPSFEDNEQQFGSKIYEHTIDKRTQEILKRVFDVFE